MDVGVGVGQADPEHLPDGWAWDSQQVAEVDDGQARPAVSLSPLLGQLVGLRPADPQQATSLGDGQEQPPPRPPDPRPAVDLNQVVAYNVKAARELRGWTQEEFAERLEVYLGQRLSQAGVSAIERAWDGDRRREFDAHELLIFAMVFDLPMIWFLLPPKGDHRLMRGTTRQVDELYVWLLGKPDRLEPLYTRLREYGIHDPTATEEVVEKLTGQPAASRTWSYKERRKEMLLALLDQHADSFDNAVEELGKTVEHLRQVGLRGFIAEQTKDDDFTSAGPPGTGEDETAVDGTVDEAAPDDMSERASRPRVIRRRGER